MKQLEKYSIAITPCDTLFFRNGSPFGMGDETWTESSLLPNPSVIWGALFTQLLHENLTRLTELENLRITDIYLADFSGHKTALYVPAPLDLFKDVKSEAHPVRNKLAEIHSGDWNVISSLPPDMKYLVLPDSRNKTEEAESQWVTLEFLFSKYPLGGVQTTWQSSSWFSSLQPKIGFGRNNYTRTVEEGQLYRIEMSEMKRDTGIVVSFSAPAGFPDSGLLKLGGEGKLAAFKKIELEKPEPSSDATRQFKMYVQTPAFFKSGDGIAELSKLENVKLVAASIGKPLAAGGFDMAQSEPKPMRNAVPPGSVYHFEGQFDEAKIRASFADPTDSAKGYNLVQFLHI